MKSFLLDNSDLLSARSYNEQANPDWPPTDGDEERSPDWPPGR